MIVLIIAIICDLVNSKSTYYYGDQGDIVFPGPASYQRSIVITSPNNPTTEQSFLAVNYIFFILNYKLRLSPLIYNHLIKCSITTLNVLIVCKKFKKSAFKKNDC